MTAIQLIEMGGAVNVGAARRNWPLCIRKMEIWLGPDCIACGAIKPARPSYALAVQRKAGAEFNPETAELGYVAVDIRHRRQGLATFVSEFLCRQYQGPLWSTTAAAASNQILLRLGFSALGKPWQGRSGLLRLYLRK